MIFCCGRRDNGTTDIRGVLRGPRGPKKANWRYLYIAIFWSRRSWVLSALDVVLVEMASIESNHIGSNLISWERLRLTIECGCLTSGAGCRRAISVEIVNFFFYIIIKCSPFCAFQLPITYEKQILMFVMMMGQWIKICDMFIQQKSGFDLNGSLESCGTGAQLIGNRRQNLLLLIFLDGLCQYGWN